MEKFRKFWKYGFVGGSKGGGGGEPPELAKILKKQPKNQWKPENFPDFLENFDFKKLILIKIKAILMEF